METLSMPHGLESYINKKKTHFAVKSQYANPRSISDIFFVLILFGFVALFSSTTFLPVLLWRTVEFTVNNVPTVAWPWNYWPLLIPWIVIGTFLLCWIVLLVRTIKKRTEPWKYFVWTDEGIVHYDEKTENIRQVDWNSCTNNVSVTGKWGHKNVLITLTTWEMRTNSKNDREYWVADVVFIWWTDKAIEVMEVCNSLAGKKVHNEE